MDRLESAMVRLSAALDALEGGVEERFKDSQPSAAALAELELLKAERERLYSRINLLEQESRDLQGLTQEIEDRLDGTVAELRDALGRRS